MSLATTSKAAASSSSSGLQLDHLLGGVAGGFTSTLVVHPLDLLKIRFAVNEGRPHATSRPAYTGYVDAVRQVLAQAGVRGLYQGITPNLIGATAAWGLYFQAYNIIKERWRAVRGGEGELSAPQHMAAGCVAGSATLMLTNPIWVVKTRLCLQYESQQRQYNGLADALNKIVRREGVRALYKGFVPGLLGTSHGAVQFAIYDELKYTYCRHKNMSTRSKLDPPLYLAFAAVSKMAAACITYPYQVVRARLQDQHTSYTGVRHVVASTYRHEGVRGFYKGLGASLLRVTPATCITFFVYEQVVHTYKGGDGS